MHSGTRNYLQCKGILFNVDTKRYIVSTSFQVYTNFILINWVDIPNDPNVAKDHIPSHLLMLLMNSTTVLDGRPAYTKEAK